MDGKTTRTYAVRALDELHVAEIGALAELGGTYLEVQGKVVMRQARRISDLANDEDELLDLEDAQIRVHQQGGEALWDSVPGLTLNRDEVLLLIPTSEVMAGNKDLRSAGRRVRVKLFCGPLQVTGFLSVPIDQTVSSYHRTTRTRFLAITQARVQPIEEGLRVGDNEGVYKFVLINRRRLTALIETRPPTIPTAAFPTLRDAATPVGPAEKGAAPAAEPAAPTETA